MPLPVGVHMVPRRNGRRAGLKIPFRRRSVGSTPTARTIIYRKGEASLDLPAVERLAERLDDT